MGWCTIMTMPLTILGNTPVSNYGGYQERKPGCCTKVGGINLLRGVENSLLWSGSSGLN